MYFAITTLLGFILFSTDFNRENGRRLIEHSDYDLNPVYIVATTVASNQLSWGILLPLTDH